MTNDLTLESVSVNQLSPKHARSIRIGFEREFGSDTMIYAEPQWYLFGYSNNEPAAQIGVLQRTVAIGQKRVLIGGLSFLITEPGFRLNINEGSSRFRKG